MISSLLLRFTSALTAIRLTTFISHVSSNWFVFNNVCSFISDWCFIDLGLIWLWIYCSVKTWRCYLYYFSEIHEIYYWIIFLSFSSLHLSGVLDVVMAIDTASSTCNRILTSSLPILHPFNICSCYQLIHDSVEINTRAVRESRRESVKNIPTAFKKKTL